MKTVIISGPAGSGKSTLARLIAEHLSFVECEAICSHKELFLDEPEVVIMDGVMSKQDWASAKELSSMSSIKIRLPYGSQVKTVDIKDRLLIITTQGVVDKSKFRDAKIFTLC